jgi:flavodoxin
MIFSTLKIISNYANYFQNQILKEITMTKVLVAYYSQTGNTEKVARAIFDALQCEKEIKAMDGNIDVQGYELIFCGFPVQAHSVPIKASTFLKKLVKDQKVAFFTTHGSLRGGKFPQQALEDALGMTKQTKVIGTFGCRGKVKPEMIDALVKQVEHEAWIDEAHSAHEHPTAADLHDAADFAREMIKKAQI